MVGLLVAYVIAAAILGFDPAALLRRIMGLAPILMLLALLPFGAVALLRGLFRR